MVKVSCHSSTVLRQKPQMNSGHPPISHSTAASATGGIKWYLFSQRSSGYFAKSAMYSVRVSLYLSEIIQPTCDQKNPKSVGECRSSSWSECRGWCRCCAAHQSTPFCEEVMAMKAITNWNTRLVL